MQVFYADGTFKFKFGSKGNGNGQFDLPAGLAVDAQNRIGKRYSRSLTRHREDGDNFVKIFFSCRRQGQSPRASFFMQWKLHNKIRILWQRDWTIYVPVGCCE
jgi:hypothetical protein